MKKDAIRQHDIQDEHGHLIPPWEMANEIRPGSIMIVVAAIWEVNTPIVNSKEGYFERVSGHHIVRCVSPLSLVNKPLHSVTSSGEDGHKY